MRIGIIGAGALGGSIAVQLANAGHDVEVTARGANLSAIRERGLRLTGAYGDDTAAVRASETLQSTPELAVLATKATDARAALEHNPLAHSADLLVIQNGVGGERRAGEIVGHERVAGGISTTAANSMEPGTANITAAGQLFVGGAAAGTVLRAFGDAVPGVQAIANLPGAQWTKLVINMVNALPAIAGLSVQDTIREPRLGKLITASMRECVRTGLASGIRFEPLQGLNNALIALIAYGPLALSRRVPLQMARVMGDVPNLGSTQQSLQRGSRTEVDYLNGQVVAAAATLGRDAPVNRAITALVHEVEQRGTTLTIDDIVARVPLR